MLVMMRGVDEGIVVGETLIRVVEIQEGHVRLAIASPQSTPRYREVTLRCDSEMDPSFLESPVALTAP
jgi:carbon storage regulator CsrA